MQKAVVVLKDAQMERLRAGKTVIIRLRDTWLTLKKEADKCDLLCANCHHIHHGGRW